MPTRWKQPCVIWEASKLDASCSIGGATICGSHAANTATGISARLMRLTATWSQTPANARRLCNAATFDMRLHNRKLLLTIH